MRRDEQTGLLFLLGLYVLARAQKVVPEAVAAAERGGARLYEATHPEEGAAHAADLPGKRLSKAALIALCTRLLFPDPKLAAAVALAESRGYPGVLGDQRRSVGLWQINLDYHPRYTRAELTDPEANAIAAFKISRGGTNWGPWTTYRNGAYRHFL